MRTLLLASAAALALVQAATAQTQTTPNDTTNQTHSPATSPSANSSAGEPADQTGSHQHMRADLKNMLEKSGYKDVRVAPTGFVVHAKDKDGNPVFMAVSSDSITEVTDVESGSGRGTTGMGNTAGSTEEFVTVADNDELSSKVVGLDIYNTLNQDIGQIKDIAMNPRGRAQAYIVSVGGFLGLGEHYVAVNPNAVKVTYNDSDKKWHAAMNASADQLKAAPEFKYTGRWNASRQ